jgi:hypothetical protein
MLATIEDEGSNTEINIWDLTEQSSGAISTTPLATIDLSAAATPTSIAASMGYLIVGSEDGIAIIDPHSGAWAERTSGWPRSLTASTTPALISNDVTAAAAGVVSDGPADPRTGGTIPCFGVSYGTTNIGSLIKHDGNVWDRTGTVGNTGVYIGGDFIGWADNDAGDRILEHGPISVITSDGAAGAQTLFATDSRRMGLGATNAVSGKDKFRAAASAAGLSIGVMSQYAGNTAYECHTAIINRTYNSGYMVDDIRGAWLANSKTADRSYKANTLTENGTVTEAVVETSAELKGYSGWSSSNYLQRGVDSDWNALGTGSVYLSTWFKSSGSSAIEYMVALNNSGRSVEFALRVNTNGTVTGRDTGATGQQDVSSSDAFEGSVWHKADFVRVSSTERYLYIDGVLKASGTGDAGSISGTDYVTVGAAFGGSEPGPANTLSLVRLSATAPTATQIRQMYDAEKGMFVASAECLLQSGTTDAVIDVDVDPLSGKVIVTQTDAITIFDGLVVDSKPTVNSGASEKGKLWGDLRAEQNSANAYVTAPATDQRQVNEMVRGLASDLPAGPDLGKAKAWIKFDGTGTVAINASYNIKSLTDSGTGDYEVEFAVPFKNKDFIVNTAGSESRDVSVKPDPTNGLGMGFLTEGSDGASAVDAGMVFATAYGELENE